MSKANKAREAELRQQIDSIQESLSATLGELAYEAQPSVQIDHAKQAAKEKAEEAKFDLITTWEAAKAGDREAMKKLAIIGAAGLGAAGLLALLVAAQTRKAKERRQWRKFSRQLRKTTPPGNISFSVTPS